MSLLKHPSEIILLNAHDTVEIGKYFFGHIGTIIKKNKSHFIEKILTDSKKYCFDEYTFNKILDSNLKISSDSIIKQKLKTEIFYNDCIEYNNKFENLIGFNIPTELIMKSDNQNIKSGKFEGLTVSELAMISPYNLEFYINNIEYFVVEENLLDFSFSPSYIFLKRTREILKMKLLIIEFQKNQRNITDLELEVLEFKYEDIDYFKDFVNSYLI